MAHQVVLDLDVVEEQVLKKLLELGLFETPQEAFKVALLKYAMDLGGMIDMVDEIDVKIPNLDRLALGPGPESGTENGDVDDAEGPDDEVAEKDEKEEEVEDEEEDKMGADSK